LNIRDELINIFQGKSTGNIPLTIYTSDGRRQGVKLTFDGERERELRNRGMGLVYRIPGFETFNPNVKVVSDKYKKDGKVFIKKIWKSPYGVLESTVQIEPGYSSYFIKEKFIKEDRDYLILDKILQDQEFHLKREKLKTIQENLGQDGILMLRANKSAYNRLIYKYVDIEKFSIDLLEEKYELYSLLATMKEHDRRCIKLLSDSPAKLITLPDNITAPMIGGERFKEHCVPFYDWACQLLKDENKFSCVHMDGHLKNIEKEIAHTDLPIVEAFTPPPDGDLELERAQKIWDDKIIWLNFPSSVHISSPEKIRERTRELLESSSPERLILGITEDIPVEHWYKSLSAILDVLVEFNANGGIF